MGKSCTSTASGGGAAAGKVTVTSAVWAVRLATAMVGFQSSRLARGMEAETAVISSQPA